MRTIKFRAWDGTKMHEVTTFHMWRNGYYTVNDSVGNPIIMQYTGLQDKNGKEIYEVDILAFETGYTRDIVFIDGCFRLRDTPYEDNYTTATIIGNIYENPELLTNHKSHE